MEMLEGTTLNSKFVAVRVNNEAINTLDTYNTANTTINTSTESRTIAEGYLGADEEVDYTVSFWMDEDATIDDDVMNKVFKSKIVINSEPGKYDPVSAGYDTLHDAILANEYQTTPEIAKTKIANKQEVDLSQTAPIIKWVEKTGESTILQVIKPAESVIKSDSQTSDLTDNDTKIALFTTKTFDSSTGRYSLSNPVYVDPTEIDFNGNIKYYFQSEYMSYNQSTKKIFTISNNVDSNIYQITGANKSASQTSWNSTIYDSSTYMLNAITMTESELETDKSDKGIYRETDDYGTTYYYRGNVKNNNVYFAGFYWQIVRINGDGSIRLIYNGTQKNAKDKDQTIGNSAFNTIPNDPAYVGYMYGNPDATTFNEVHANVNDSTVKSVIDNWYKYNIYDNGYNKYLSTTVGFCGDRTLSTDSGDGIQTDRYSDFGALGRQRLQTATFVCPEPSRDLYTTADSNIGNNALTYPIGLITYDELAFAGLGINNVNKLSWIYSSQIFWTMSPTIFNITSNCSYVHVNLNTGLLSNWYVSYDNAIRPVINLKSDVKITGGIGTANDPYVVDTNN